jgi:hypothetical protein
MLLPMIAAILPHNNEHQTITCKKNDSDVRITQKKADRRESRG